MPLEHRTFSGPGFCRTWTADSSGTGCARLVLIEGAKGKDANVDKAATQITAKTQLVQDGKKWGKNSTI